MRSALRLAIALTAAAAACAELPAPADTDPPPPPPPPPTTGSLAITIAGLPGGQSADVTVTGPGSYTQTLTASNTLSGLTPGNYVITAALVAAGGIDFTPAPASQIRGVSAGGATNATVFYTGAINPSFGLRAEEVVPGLSSPVYLTAPPGDPRLFIVEQPGRIRIFKEGALLATPFLDIESRVVDGGERGLLSMAFDPAYATNGRFYVYYTGSNGDIFVDRHTVSANPDIANVAYDQVITVQHRYAGNHNGGLVMFGPDGMLYLAPGDGGGGGDPQDNGQNINSLLGKLLRLDVTNLPYTIPPTNPFANQPGADEIWAIGLRNPWRYTFDTGDNPAKLYIADVGQNAWEEINALDAATPGVNYGWRIMEGAHCYNPSSGCTMTGLTLPVHEYSHTQGCSITGGFVYRGSALPEIVGHYFYSDYCSGGLRSFRLSGGLATDHRTWQIGSIGNVLSFGRDGAGELYMTSGNGRVYRLVRS